MFREETVFILGAGASCHYKCPSGSGLIERIRILSEQLAHDWSKPYESVLANKDRSNSLGIAPKYFEILSKENPWVQGQGEFIAECYELLNRLNQVNPLIIDYFLDKNKDLQNIGKLIIAYELLLSEQQFSQQFSIQGYKENFFKEDDWIKFILSKMIDNCNAPKKLLENKISFITFNYDVTLEHRIYKAIKPITFFSNSEKEDFFNKSDLIIHLYGKIRENGFEESDFGQFSIPNSRTDFSKMKEDLDKAWESAQKICTISEVKKQGNALDKAKEKISKAKNIFILGYGFDQENSKNLHLYELLKCKSGETKNIFFTNLANMNRINKRASEIFFGTSDRFINQTAIVDENNWHFEKSIKNVYKALSEDFDL